MSEVVRTAAEVLFQSDRFTLARESFTTPDGLVTRPVIHHPGAVAIIAQPSPGTLLLVRQYRYPIQRWTLEIPAGTRVVGEAPEATAARELQEEAGYAASRLQEVTRLYPAVGVSDEEMILYRAFELTEVPAGPEPGELVRREVVTLTDLPRLWSSGLLCDAKTIIAVHLLGVPLITTA